MPNGNVGKFERAVFVNEDNFEQWSEPYKNLNMKPQALRRIFNEQKRDVVYKSEYYQVAINKTPQHGFAGAIVWWLSIKRLDKEPIMDWRDLQAIKTQLCGAEAEGFQLFPSEDRVVDTSNQYHLFVFMKMHKTHKPQIPIYALGTRRTVSDDGPNQPWKQRPLSKTDDPIYSDYGGPSEK